jgi:hypothetical protein
MKKLSTLLTQRPALLRQLRLANLAFAYAALSDFGQRIARARLTGRLRLQQANPRADRYWATLTALEGNQSVVDEHFADEDLMAMADVLGFITGHDPLDITFEAEDLTDIFLAPVRSELDREGIAIDRAESVTEESRDA